MLHYTIQYTCCTTWKGFRQNRRKSLFWLKCWLKNRGNFWHTSSFLHAQYHFVFIFTNLCYVFERKHICIKTQFSLMGSFEKLIIKLETKNSKNLTRPFCFVCSYSNYKFCFTSQCFVLFYFCDRLLLSIGSFWQHSSPCSKTL